MTEHQVNLLEFIRQRIEQSGVRPSYVEMCEALGLRSRSAVVRVVDALVREGHLLRAAKGQRRGLTLSGANLRAVPTAALVAELARREYRLG